MKSLCDVAAIGLLYAFICDRYDPSLLWNATTLTGGDAASWYQSVVHLRELLSEGRVFGWDQHNFFGYPHFQYYFVPPFLLAVLLGTVLPLTVALKLVTAAGVAALPLAVYTALRCMRYPFPVPLIGVWASAVFLFHERWTMFGGNVLSTLAGEFSYSIAFALMAAFMGLLHRGMEQRRHLIANALLLGFIGLTHAFVFLVAAAMPLYFLWSRQSFRTHFSYVAALYALAFLVMAFWVVPMLVQYGYTTPINMIWRFYETRELLHGIHYEILALAGVALVAARFAGRRHHANFFLYMLAVATALYFAATALRIADIRFFPPLLFFALLLIVDAAACWMGSVPRHRTTIFAGAVVLTVLAGGAWIYAPGAQGPDWYRWNYSGYEAKQAHRDGTLEGLKSLLRAGRDAPRVAWEKAEYNSRWGSDRVFENLPLLVGRRSTEGVHYASALLSKEITWMHGEYSLHTASPEPLIYGHYNIDALPARFRMFNIQEFIAASPEITHLMSESGHFLALGRAGPYTVFRLRESSGGYVETPQYRPQLALTANENWRRRFYAWFRRAESLDVPLVSAHGVSGAHRARYFSHGQVRLDDYGVAHGVNRKPVPRATVSGVRVENDRIRFRTDRPGEPHIVKVAFSPNWRARGGEPIFLVSPGLMLIHPQTAEVEIYYARHWSERLGAVLSGAGLALMMFAARRNRWQRWIGAAAASQCAAAAERVRLPLVVLVCVGALALGIWSYQAKQRVFADYMTGNRLAALNKEAALVYYRRAATDENVRTLDNADVPMALYALGRTYFELERHEAAQEPLERLLHAYPMWMYAHEVHWYLGEIARKKGQAGAAVEHYRACMRIDAHSPYYERCRKQVMEALLRPRRLGDG